MADVADLRRRVVAGARDTAVGAVGGRRPTARAAAVGAAADADPGVLAGGVADRLRAAGGGGGMAAGESVLRLRPAARSGGPGLPGAGAGVGRGAGPVHAVVAPPGGAVGRRGTGDGAGRPRHQPQPVAAPTPFVPWAEVGDGSVYACMPGCAGDGADDVRSRYAASVGYSLQSVVSFAAEHPDLVVLLVGDHQPWRQVAGEDPGHDVPASLVAADPAVLERISQWGWTPGLVPGEQSPVWRMDAFRDHFLTAFSTRPPGPAPGAAHRRSAGSRSRAPAARRGRRSPRTPCRDAGSR